MNINPLYALPNLFTAGSIFLGVVSIMFSSNAMFEWSCWLIVASMVLDGLDGRVARITHTSSKFGVEFDSLADVVSFGVAPAMLLYFYIGGEYGRYGIVVSAIFVIFGAIRLARFNVATADTEPNSFIGLPIPSAAVLVVLWILVDIKYGIFGIEYGYMILIATFVLSVLMVSNIRYPSFKKIKWNLKSFVVLLIFLAVAFLRPREVLSICMTFYALYGILRWVFLVGRMFIKKI
ncbi:CDP-diacylglycerol--serine O-phosphatidyltransferase [Helicobacter sp. 12S02232-10]|uniref:CDP-diacylglycerol--serine O-phosphatidyltransferase n=1 Tax=Helicobacter sp. 12S02232-10 TaxID=1476197 RepID=UPI000BA60032|nr:CDP-diacylglycerol--serine O-phosphatidyltransferase [Helicobacter sp. 12S02232-10]PAF49583.1 CDP-diacylglycerol--serine O-phosphatidyltransferase [Helicobacter sp. 12S02232-10]